ncbi:DNA glycosylase [Macrolepiota fuliginosa MF-IS2]|uniref:Endonuclease III homolog n=1 Tax=Macrolepiota fuliginosa MF-IS2 TaxID=1400762 RepID=A0A9P5XLR8_9AGAR|nr:DNA glycosylase [Macrolepiota fuliginosa MF-IS2]
MASSSSRITRTTARSMSLRTRPSILNSSVTIYEPEDIEALSTSVSPEPIPESSRRTKRIKREYDYEPPASSTPRKRQKSDASIPRKVVKATPPKKAKPIPQALAEPHPAPENWREVYDTIKEMRSRITAPVDTMGCDQAQRNESDPKNRRFSTLVALMLSSQTKDEVTDAAVIKLRAAVGGSLSIDAVIKTDESVIAEAINKVGFWRRKSGYIKKAAEKLRDDFDSDVPKTVDELCSLSGVGPKMAFLTLQVAWNLNHGIGVDVHVHRITNRLGWHKKPTKNPEETRLNLQSWLPTELHRDINHLLVGFGQVICVPVGPRCDTCELSKKGLCPSAQKVVKTTKRKPIVPSAPDSPAKVKIELEEDAKYPKPPIDQESMAQLEIMPKEEEEDLPIPKSEIL